MRDFATADCGSNGIRRQHKNESVGAINCGVDGLHPFFRRANVLPVHPRLSTTTFQSLIQTTHKVSVLARIRNEDFLWAWQLLVAGRCWHGMLLQV